MPTENLCDYETLARLFTHNNYSKRVMFGKYDDGAMTSYVAKAGYTHTYFQMPQRNWNALSKVFGKDMWKINEAFLRQQMDKMFCFSHSPLEATGAFLAELKYLKCW